MAPGNDRLHSWLTPTILNMRLGSVGWLSVSVDAVRNSQDTTSLTPASISGSSRSMGGGVLIRGAGKRYSSSKRL